MLQIKANAIVDAIGLSCPIPIVKTKKAINNLEAGHVIEVQATDKGSTADMKAWAESTGHQYLGTIENGNVLSHFLRKSSNDHMIEKQFPHIKSNDELEVKLKNGENIVLLDVRESAEYLFNHIQQAISIPLGELEKKMSELNTTSEIYVICRTGNRSDLAAQILSKNRFMNVYNVLPGMNQWTGETTGFNN